MVEAINLHLIQTKTTQISSDLRCSNNKQTNKNRWKKKVGETYSTSSGHPLSLGVQHVNLFVEEALELGVSSSPAELFRFETGEWRETN